MSSKIGSLKITMSDQGRVFGRGQFRTLAVSLQIRLDPDPMYQGKENQPTHEVLAVMGDNAIPVGKAWRKTIKRGEHEGARMFSMTLDDPSFVEPLNLSAFPRDRDGQEMDIVWQRPLGGRPSASQVAANAAAYDAAKEAGGSGGGAPEPAGFPEQTS